MSEASDGSTDPESQHPVRRGSRRVVRPAAAGSDPTPADHGFPEEWDGETAPQKPSRGENDDRLRRDKPPHWG